MSDIIEDARRRIRKVRMQNVELTVLKNGVPVPHAPVQIRMKQHQFLFGAVCYAHGTFQDAEKEETFTNHFTKLFNYTMVPFHWGWYEPQRGKYHEPYTENLVQWAEEHLIKRKMHALIWHEVCPDWLTDGKGEEEYDRRINYLMARYGDRFDFFDLANETTVNDRFDNPVSRWVRQKGPVNMMKFGTRLVRSWKPDAQLLYGEWNVHHEEYYQLLQEMRDHDVDIDILGIQSHMHRDIWTFEETLRVMDRASSYGWPLHFSECSICSGRPIGEMSYAPGAVNHFSETEEDLYWQADFAKDFYTLVFSHPAVEALSWFDFTDHRWLKAPAGLLKDDLSPKPAYEALYDLIHRQWHTDADLVTDENGVCRTRLFFGEYDISVGAGSERGAFHRSLLRPSFYEGSEAYRRISVNLP